MELWRFLRQGVSLILLLLLENILFVTPFSGLKNETSFTCSNDYDTFMFCQLRPRSDQPNCTEYSLDVAEGIAMKCFCLFQQSQDFSGECSCFVKMSCKTFVLGDSLNLILKDGERLENKAIKVESSIKPKTPTITSVKQSKNGNFWVTWNKNYKSEAASELFTSVVTYRKKGELNGVSKHVPTTSTFYEILGQDLDSSTKYMVSVKTYCNYSKQFSDSSEEEEFKTPVSSVTELLAIIISLSVVAVIGTSVLFGCWVRYKAKWWDTVAKPQDSKLLSILPGEQKLLQPSEPTFSAVYVDPPFSDDGKPWSKCSLIDTSGKSLQQSSGMNSGSSSLGYANTGPVDIISNVQEALCKALPQFAMMVSTADSSHTESTKDSGLLSADYSPFGARADDFMGSSSSFDNRTYSILLPGCQKLVASDSSEIQQQPVMSCDLAYQPSEGEVFRNACPDQHVVACLETGQQDAKLALAASSSMQTDFSYQPCNADAGSSSSAEDSSLSSASIGINVSEICNPASSEEAGCENGDEAVSSASDPTEIETQDVYSEEALLCDANPCYSSLPAPSHSFPTMDDGYQDFQSLVKQPDVSFPEQSSVEPWQQAMARAVPVHPGFIDSAQGGHCLPEFQSSFLSALSSDHCGAVITDSGYQSV